MTTTSLLRRSAVFAASLVAAGGFIPTSVQASTLVDGTSRPGATVSTTVTPQDDVSVQGRACKRLKSGDGAWAEVCKTWYKETDFTYYGSWWTESKSPSAVVWFDADGEQGAKDWGSYRDTYVFSLAVCGNITCSGWW